MTLRSGHGTGAGVPRIEVLPADELPKPVTAPVPATAAALERRPNGTFTPESARRAGAKGGASPRRRADAKKLAKKFGLGRLIERWKADGEIEKFVTESEAWFVQACEDMSRDVGGGQLSPGVTSMLRSSAYQRAFSAFLYDCATRTAHAWETLAPHAIPNSKPRLSPRMDLVATATRLADSSRQNYMAAFEIAAKEAQARKATQRNEPYDLGAVIKT
jgi:hypothetical protein